MYTQYITFVRVFESFASNMLPLCVYFELRTPNMSPLCEYLNPLHLICYHCVCILNYVRPIWHLCVFFESLSSNMPSLWMYYELYVNFVCVYLNSLHLICYRCVYFKFIFSQKKTGMVVMANGVLPIWSKWGICITPTQKMSAFISSIGILCTPGFLKGQCHSFEKNLSMKKKMAII